MTAVDCPLCHKSVPLDTINEHMDSNCKNFVSASLSGVSLLKQKGKQRQEWSKILSGGSGTSAKRSKEKERAKSEAEEDEYLPKVSYHPLKDKQLLELLHKHDLPTSGDRNAWIKRHQKWVMLYNANVDRAPEDRRTREQMRRDLRRWEDETRPPAKKTVVADTTAYQVANRAEFAQLVEAARPKKLKTQEPNSQDKDELAKKERRASDEPVVVDDDGEES